MMEFDEKLSMLLKRELERKQVEEITRWMELFKSDDERARLRREYDAWYASDLRVESGFEGSLDEYITGKGIKADFLKKAYPEEWESLKWYLESELKTIIERDKLEWVSTVGEEDFYGYIMGKKEEWEGKTENYFEMVEKQYLKKWCDTRNLEEPWGNRLIDALWNLCVKVSERLQKG
jgi:hypothetical protein